MILKNIALPVTGVEVISIQCAFHIMGKNLLWWTISEKRSGVESGKKSFTPKSQVFTALMLLFF